MSETLQDTGQRCVVKQAGFPGVTLKMKQKAPVKSLQSCIL